MSSLLQRLLKTSAPAATIWVRLAVGGLFLSEGLQKQLFPDSRGAGRFLKFGMPEPEIWGTIVGISEVFFGVLILVGLFTRVASFPLFIIMCFALYLTKADLLMDGYGWEFLHEGRTDLLMLGSLLFLMGGGGGRWSLDARLMADRYGAVNPYR